MITYSVIIPHKNKPDLLLRCVDSIPERDDVQIIVVDDNSDEDKKPVLPERKGLEIVLLDASQSKGAGRARNVGLKHAEGKWLLFPDSDDYYYNGFMDVLGKYEESSYDVIYFNFDFKDGKTGENLTPLRFRQYFMNYDDSREGKDQIKFLHNVPWTKMVSHSYVKEHQICFEEVPNGNDILFSMMVGYYTDNMAVEKEPLYVYLQNENSILTSQLSGKGALCKMQHVIQKNYFLENIGYPQWKSPLARSILSFTKRAGIPFVIILLFSSLKLYRNRKDWCFKKK